MSGRFSLPWGLSVRQTHLNDLNHSKSLKTPSSRENINIQLTHMFWFFLKLLYQVTFNQLREVYFTAKPPKCQDDKVDGLLVCDHMKRMLGFLANVVAGRGNEKTSC